MDSGRLELKQLGWTDWFEQRAGCGPSDKVARVAAVDRDQLLLIDQSGPFRAKLAGSYRHRHQLSPEMPCVGDWVCVDQPPGGDLGLVHSLLPRRTMLRRRSAGEHIDDQMISANVDYVIIVMSCHFDFNVNRLERYLVMVRDGGAEPCVLFTKTDLVEPAVLAFQLSEVRSSGVTVPVMALSNVTQEGVADLQQSLLPGMTYCFVGSSGVGKSTLINQLIGRPLRETDEVSGTGEGRHTTVRRELMLLECGALVIDNPGMREFGVVDAGEGISESFSDIVSRGSDCRYRDCTHAQEPGCAVLEAVRSGTISEAHYENYKRLRQESEFYGLSYAEKRKKDRDLGRYFKSVKKDLKRR